MPKTTKTTKKKPAAKSKPPVSVVRKAPKRTVSSRSKATKQRRGVVHHAKRLYRVTPKFLHGMVVGAVVGILIITQFGTSTNASALQIAAGKDCDNYSIINCGVTSSGDLQKTYAGAPYVKHVYSYYGISSSDIDNIGQTAVQGTVYKNGDVKIGTKLVATGVLTAARLRVTSGDKQITSGGSTFYQRPIASSWSHNSALAYVVMKNGNFQFAILAPCGNPVVPPVTITSTPPTPVPSPPKPPKPPTPTPPAPQPTASLVCDSLGRNNNGLTYTFVARATAKNTTIKSYSFYLSDTSKPVVVKSSASIVSVQHKFPNFSAKYSAYVIVASDKVTTQKSAACAKDFVTPAVSECKPGLPVGSAECKQCDKTNDSGDNACAPPPVNVVTAAKITSLPDTGPGAVLFVLAVSMVCGTLFHKTHHHLKKRRAAKRPTHHPHHA